MKRLDSAREGNSLTQDKGGQGPLARLSDNVVLGTKIGGGAAGAKTLDAAVRKSISKLNGGEVPAFLESELGERVSPLMSAALLHLLIASPVGAALPNNAVARIEPLIDYMEVGAAVDLSEPLLSALLGEVLNELLSLPFLKDEGDEGSNGGALKAVDDKKAKKAKKAE